jgi:hypothetical protein
MKKMKKHTNKQSLLLASLSAFILVSCTKEIPMETISPEVKKEDFSVGLFDTKSEFLMSSSMLNASRSSSDALPFSSGENKRVKLTLTKDSLRIIETERDERYSANNTNDKLVMEIPAEYVQYQCAKDRYGECTNKEEANIDIPWNERSTIRMKFDQARVTELNLLPIFDSQTFGENCYQKVAGRILSATVEADAINLTYENTFQTNINCLQELDKISDATVTAVFHVSLVKVDSVLSKDYKTISYPDGSADEQTFGFFTSKKNKLDVDNNNTDKSLIQIMNRWNPSRKEIVYYLSDEFAKPENKQIKDLTYQTVDNLNKGLKIANVNFRINLKEPAGKVAGDIRNSMIVLVEDPVASNVIGYGPQTEDPVTGEIISARTVMFLGTIKTGIKMTYNDIIREKNERKATKSRVALKLSDELMSKVEILKKSGKVFGASELSESVLSKITPPTQKVSAKGSDKLDHIALPAQKIMKMKSSLKQYTQNKNQDYSGTDLKSQLRYLKEVKNCAFTSNMEGAAGGISTKLMDKFADDAKPWDQLSDSEKENVIAIILPEVWVPTLIHEMGHNLGLRHNFAASEDKENFLNNEELQSMNADHAFPFSSVMDYGDDLKALPVLGKYDIAALKFGYLRQVEVVSGDGTHVVNVEDTLEKLNPELTAQGAKLKEFQYCTDEHTGINAGCKRFDLGTSYTEIVQNLIKSYEDFYVYRNLRNGRASMSLVGDLSYGSRINSIFKELRIMMEVVERLKYRFDLAEDAPEWESVDFLKDLKQASLIGGSFLTNVLLVPDVTCAVALASDPTQVIAILPMTNIDPEAISCFKLKLKDEYKVVAQAGKMFNSKKDPESKNAYADQIDVRGIWMDKVMAIRNLTKRQIGILSMDEHSDTFLNMPELRKGILESVKGLMTNNVVNKVPFTLADGTQVPLEISYDMGKSQVIKKPFLIDMLERQGAPASVIERYAGRMGVRTSGTTPLQQTLAFQMVTDAVDLTDTHLEDKEIGASLSVYKMQSIVNQKFSKSAKMVTIDNTIYVADVANSLARESIENLAVATTLEKVSADKIKEILMSKMENKPMPPKTGADEKAVWKLSEEVLADFLNEVLKPSNFYKQLLAILPAAT